MNDSSSVIIRLDHTNVAQQSLQGVKINKIISSISPTSFIKLLQVADNKINPRTATVNSVTDAIDETLRNTPSLFWYKTKGILLASKSCQILERNRVKLTFSDPDFEGIMDGGHNTFAIARFLMRELIDKESKTWKDCKNNWKDVSKDLLSKLSEEENNPKYNFSIPIEIITPTNAEGALEEYYDAIAEICTARNNNNQLRETAKGNQVGYYDYLKEKLSNYDIVWKTGESGRIKSENVLAMADIPLFFLQELGKLPDDIKKFNRISLYSSKSQCVNFFNEVIGHPDISRVDKGKVTITNNLIKSALAMTEDIMKFFDILYDRFPGLYNANQGSFGRISSVEDKECWPLFRTLKNKCRQKYPDGFIYPLISGVYRLMEYDEQTNTLKWIVNPASKDFSITNLPLGKYVSLIKIMDYNPQKVGKTQLVYIEAADDFATYVRQRNY